MIGSPIAFANGQTIASTKTTINTAQLQQLLTLLISELTILEQEYNSLIAAQAVTTQEFSQIASSTVATTTVAMTSPILSQIETVVPQVVQTTTRVQNNNSSQNTQPAVAAVSAPALAPVTPAIVNLGHPSDCQDVTSVGAGSMADYYANGQISSSTYFNTIPYPIPASDTPYLSIAMNLNSANATGYPGETYTINGDFTRMYCGLEPVPQINLWVWGHMFSTTSTLIDRDDLSFVIPTSTMNASAETVPIDAGNYKLIVGNYNVNMNLSGIENQVYGSGGPSYSYSPFVITTDSSSQN